MKNLYNEVKCFIHRNAREIEFSLWRYFFEGGKEEEVINALVVYQNEDGGFGHALEADNWNPDSTPIATGHALKILKSIGFMDMNHPVYQGIWKYLLSEKDLSDYGWKFTIPTNDEYPHAPWWNYSEEQNEKETYGITAGLCAFILEYGDKANSLYSKAEKIAEQLLQTFMVNEEFGDMGLEGYISLIDAVNRLGLFHYDINKLQKILSTRIKKSIEHDTDKWVRYGVRPSNYIKGPDSPFYEENKEIVHAELRYLMETKPKQDIWPITWTWFDNMAQYEKYFFVSENWWKCFKAIENISLLKNFEILL